MTTFTPATYSNIILQRHQIITDMNTDIIYIYSKAGYYNSLNSLQLLKTEINTLLGVEATTYKVNEIVNYIKRYTYHNINRFDPASEYVCLNNHLLNLHTMEVEKHTPDKFVFYRIPVNADNDVDMEPWNNYIHSLVGCEDDALKLQEAVGNIFANHYETKKLLYIYGKQDSGKSTFFRILQHFFTEENYSSLSLNELGKRFTNASIYGKRVNIYPDIHPTINIKYYGIIKSFTGGDSVTFEYKHKDAFQYTNVAKLFFSGNGIPQINKKEADDAFYRRWEFIHFPHLFEPDETFIKKYTTHEMKSALLAWALQGYLRLKQQKWKFTDENSIDDVKDIFKQGTLKLASMQDWMAKNCEPNPAGFTSKKKLFNDYRRYLRDRDEPYDIALNSFCKRLANQTLIKVISIHPTINGEQVPCFSGIKIRKKEK